MISFHLAKESSASAHIPLILFSAAQCVEQLQPSWLFSSRSQDPMSRNPLGPASQKLKLQSDTFSAFRKGSPAFAIALAGGYADDDDTGAEFWYNLVPPLEQSSHNTGH